MCQVRCLLAGIVLYAFAACPSAHAACGTTRAAEVVSQARTLVPDGSHLMVRAIDPELTGDPVSVSRLDAFIVRERNGSLRRVVYLNCRSPLFEAAAGGSGLHLQFLAAVIVHEVRHIEGGNERQALAAERAFIESLRQRGQMTANDATVRIKDLGRLLH